MKEYSELQFDFFLFHTPNGAPGLSCATMRQINYASMVQVFLYLHKDSLYGIKKFSYFTLDGFIARFFPIF